MTFIDTAYTEGHFVVTKDGILQILDPGQHLATAQDVLVTRSATEALGVMELLGAQFTPWSAGEEVSQGDQRAYDGLIYECRQPHTTQADWAPPVVLALWEVFRTDDMTDWIPGVTVNVGEEWQYGGSTYRVLQAHTTQAEWTPPVVPALWELVIEVPEGPQPWVQPVGAGDAYPLGALVTFGGQTWENTGSAANVWQPGVFGWTQI